MYTIKKPKIKKVVKCPRCGTEIQGIEFKDIEYESSTDDNFIRCPICDKRIYGVIDKDA